MGASRYFDTTWGTRDSGVDEAIGAAREARRVDRVSQMKRLTLWWIVTIITTNYTLYGLQRVVSINLGHQTMLNILVVVVFTPFFLQVAFTPIHYWYLLHQGTSTSTSPQGRPATRSQ